MSSENPSTVLGWTSSPAVLLEWRAAPQTIASSTAHSCVQALRKKRMTVLSVHSKPKPKFNLQNQTQEAKVSSQSHFKRSELDCQDWLLRPSVSHIFAWTYTTAEGFVANYPADSIALSVRKGTKLIKNNTGQLLGMLTSLSSLTESLHFLSLLQNMYTTVFWGSKRKLHTFIQASPSLSKGFKHRWVFSYASGFGAQLPWVCGPCSYHCSLNLEMHSAMLCLCLSFHKTNTHKRLIYIQYVYLISDRKKNNVDTSLLLQILG